MDSQRWEQIQALFLAALDRPPAERAAFLDEACGGDSELALEVATLLECLAEDRALAIEHALLVDDRPPTSADDSDPLPTVRAGPYRLLRRIGRGGMGEVYLAERDEPYRQEVAVKFVRFGLHLDEVIRRFRAERQILARLVHPNIARLLDGGVTEDGRPYLVMEYVVGVPVTEYCDRRRLTIPERLRLFATVCDAVQFAHGNLIVHRDVKPSNVLVTDGGDVRLLDFGIAKLLDPADSQQPFETQTSLRLLTPDYAAPEQVRGGSVTTATDVYALGVLLYELLTGHHPHRFSTRTQAEIERVVCEQPPSSPSTVVLTHAERPTADGTTTVVTPEDVSDQRGIKVVRLRKTLRGDLDNIVLMALRKEPERRYVSAAQLAEDIDRYLVGRPVIAQKDTIAYRARKFVRRNRTAVAVAAGVFALMLGFGVAVTVQAGALARERDRARVEAAKATQVAGFLEELFEAPDPFAPTSERRDTMRARDLLVEGTEKVRTELSSQPVVQAQLFNVLGSVFQSLGDLDGARPLLEEALQLRRRVHGDVHLEVAESQHALAMLWKAMGRHDEAESLLREALATRTAQLGEPHADVASNLNALASVLHDQGDYGGAETLYKDALEMWRRLRGPRHLDVASSMNNLSTLFYHTGEFGAADSMVRQALDIRRSVLGAEHPEVAMTMVQLAAVSGERMEKEEVEGLFREALRILRSTLGPEHPRVALTLNNLGGFLRREGDLEGAEAAFRETLAMWRSLVGNEHVNVALVLHNLGAVMKTRGEFEEAESLYRQSLAMRRRLLGERHPSVAASFNNLGVLLKEMGQRGEAIDLLRQAIDVNRELLGPEHPRVATTMITLGELLHDAGRYGEAEPLYLEALAIYQARGAEDESSAAGMYPRLYRLYRDWNRPEQAALFESAPHPPVATEARSPG